MRELRIAVANTSELRRARTPGNKPEAQPAANAAILRLLPITKEGEMKTYTEIQAEIARLEKQASAARKGEAAGVIERIKEAIAEYGLTAEDLGFSRGKAATKATAKRAAKASESEKPTTIGVAKYRDPATGKTWTGRGKPPDWIKVVKNRDQLLIDAVHS
jgi:DNA-binding protein H-NS